MKGANQRALALALVALVALAARSWSWPLVFTDRGVRLLADTDPHYHVLRAERILHPSGAGVWFDPNLDWPNGAEVLWPPLFDGLLAATAWVAAGPEADRDDIARVGSYVPPVLGTVAVILAALLAAALAGEGAAVVTGFLCALMPALSDVSIVGRPDQHALEIPLALAAWLGFVHAWRSTDARRRRVAVAAAGISFALAFWNWMGSALVLAVPALAVAVLHAADDVSARAAARALGASAAVRAHDHIRIDALLTKITQETVAGNDKTED